MTGDLEIGVSDLEGNGFTGFGQWFRLEANKDNPYRVLPPLFSNATTGRWSQYYPTHSVWVTNANNKRRPYHFQCIEEKNKQGQILRDCPFCMAARENKARYEAFKEKAGESEEAKKKAFEFLKRHVWPLEANKRVYINVVNIENGAGVLEMPYKLFEALKAKLIEIRRTMNQDATGNPGLYLNFKKTQKYKGDRDTAYSVEQYLERGVDSDGQQVARFKSHVLNEAAIAAIKKGCKDLSDLFPTINDTEMNQLLGVLNDNNALTELCERIFSHPEPVVQKVEDASTGAVYTSKTEVVDGNIKTDTNYNTDPSPLSPAQPAPAQADPMLGTMPSAPVSDGLTTPSVAPQSSQPDSLNPAESLTDDDFAAFFGG